MSVYAETLAALWAAHLTPRDDDAPTVVSLFSGCGGSSLGYSAAGYRELLAADRDPRACQVFRANFPGVAVHSGDVAALDPGGLDLVPGALDLLDASPPCQSFSVTGLRRAADPRGQLWREVIRLALAWQPRAVVIENVAGLARGSMREVFSAICGALGDAGYAVAARLVDASYLGVPQRRQRVFIIGARADLGAPPAFPVPVTRPLTVRDAWDGLGDPGEYLVPVSKGAPLAPLVEPGRDGSAALRSRGGKVTHFNVKRLAWDRPSNTLCRDVRVHTAAGYLHPAEPRFCGTRELGRLQSFPDEWDWAGLPYADVHHLIGNSVPPLASRAVGAALLPALRPDSVARTGRR